MPERPDQDRAGVRPASLCPGPQSRGEVPRIAGDEDPPFRDRKLEHLVVVHPLGGRLGGEREHVVPGLAQRRTDAPRGQLVIEQQPHARPSARVLAESDEGVEPLQLVRGAAVLRDRLVDLLRVGVAVCGGEADVRLRHEREVVYHRPGGAVAL